jgi:hypothetical protein
VSTCEPIGAAVNFIGVADARGGDRTAGIDVHALPLAATVVGGEAGSVRVGGARELAARIDGVERGAGNGAIGGDREQIQQAAEVPFAVLSSWNRPSGTDPSGRCRQRRVSRALLQVPGDLEDVIDVVVVIVNVKRQPHHALANRKPHPGPL